MKRVIERSAGFRIGCRDRESRADARFLQAEPAREEGEEEAEDVPCRAEETVEGERHTVSSVIR